MLSPEEIKKIASLARIGLDEKDIKEYQKDLSAILDYFKKLSELDTENVEPVGYVIGQLNVARSDKREDFGDLGKKAILKNVPGSKDGYVKVKSVL